MIINIKLNRQLKTALRANALFSSVSGLTIVMAHDAVIGWLGLAAVDISLIGYGLLGFAAYLLWLASRTHLPRVLVSVVIAGDWGWVAATAVLLALKSSIFSTLGIFLLIDIAVIVAILAIWQQRGIGAASQV